MKQQIWSVRPSNADMTDTFTGFKPKPRSYVFVRQKKIEK